MSVHDRWNTQVAAHQAKIVLEMAHLLDSQGPNLQRHLTNFGHGDLEAFQQAHAERGVMVFWTEGLLVGLMENFGPKSPDGSGDTTGRAS